LLSSTVPKNAEFGADFESIDKVAKNSLEKIYQQNSEWSFFTFIAMDFPLIPFLGELFALFSTDSNAALNFFCYLWNPIKFV
jgi:hypothetical protein